jgi:hypothetical protein
MEHQMKKFVAIAFAAVSLMAGPAVFVGTSSSALAQQQCEGPGVPEAWLRPGGFCEQLGGGSLVEQPNECPGTYHLEAMVTISTLAYGESILVAEEECHEYQYQTTGLL